MRLLRPWPISTHPDKYILQLVESRQTSILLNNVVFSLYYSGWQHEALNHSFSLTFLIIYSTLINYLLNWTKAVIDFLILLTLRHGLICQSLWP